MPQLKFIPGEQLPYLASTAAVAISKEFDLDNLLILSEFFNALGYSLGLIVTQREIIERLAEKEKEATEAERNATKE